MIVVGARPQRQGNLPLAAAAVRPSRVWSGYACSLLMAAACSSGGGDPGREVVFPPSTTAGVEAIVAGAGMGAGVSGTHVVPGTAGNGIPVGGDHPTPGGTGPRPAGSGGSGPSAGTGGTPPLLDGGLPMFDGGIEPTRNQVMPGGLCDRFTTLQCAGEQHCCATAGRTFQACKTQGMMECEMGALDDIAKNAVAGFSPTHAEAAFAKMEEYAAACDPGATAWVAQPDVGLRSIMQGTVAPSGACKPMGLASTARYGAALASCTQPATHACLFTGDGPLAAPTSATCMARGDVGAACFMDVNCKDGLYCANPQMKYSSGTCAVPKAAGATCTADAECSTLTCRGAVCVVATAQTAYCIVH